MNLVVIGASGHAAVVIDILERSPDRQIIGVVDDDPSLVGQKVLNWPILGRVDQIAQVATEHKVTGIVIAIGENYVRSRVVARLAELAPHLRAISAIHPTAVIGRGSSVGPGSVLCAQSVIGVRCSVGAHCIVNTAASLDHDSEMHDFSSLGPGGRTGGNVTIGPQAAVCMGASIKHGVAIGEHTVIGANSLVLQTVPSFSLCYGTPARVIRTRTVTDRYL